MKIRLRRGTTAEHPLVYDSFIKHLASSSGLPRSDVDMGARRLMTRVLAKPGVILQCAVDAEDDSRVAGLAIHSGDTLWWVYVKRGCQQWGVARALLNGLPRMRAPWLGRNSGLVARCCPLVYDPLAILEV